jgi:predicted nuclease with TOPRIM domain
LQGSLRSTLLYCYIRKVSASDDGTEDLKKKLVEAEGENAKLKEAIAKKEEDLQLLGQHSALMECEASDASEAEDRVEAGLSKLSEEFMGLQAKYALL